MKNVLVHLHPDFSEELEEVLKNWNEAQSTLRFRGLHLPKEVEAELLAPGAVSSNETFKIAAEARSSAGYKKNDEIILFTEKRIFAPGYYQLYFDGSPSKNATTISLDFTRRLFADSSETDNYIFRAILNNIINSLAQDSGLESHDDPVGCVLDFCNNMPDIIMGIQGGPRFCASHLKQINVNDLTYLVKLVEAVANSKEIARQDIEISRRITAFEQPVEIGIVVALQEEFEEVFDYIRARAKPILNEFKEYYYVFERGTGSSTYRCVITFIGGMGPTKAALAADRLLQQFKPTTIVNIGIAGSMDRQVWVGDLVVAEQVDEYLSSAKAVKGTKSVTLEFRLSGDPYKGSPEYVNHAKNLKFAHSQFYESWQSQSADRLATLVTENTRKQLLKKGLIREHPLIRMGNIASGSIVGADEVFINWLKDSRDRKYLALEMEAAGVMSAAHARNTRTLVIRGISDYGDTRKAELDALDDGALRRYAMNSVITLLWMLMDLQLLR